MERTPLRFCLLTLAWFLAAPAGSAQSVSLVKAFPRPSRQ